MKAEYQDDAQAGAGHGILRLSEAIFPEMPWTLAIQRSSDQAFLSGRPEHPWTGEAVNLPVAGSVNADGSLSLALTPDIVDKLDQQEQYAVTLQGNGEPQKGRLRISSITYSPSGSLGITPEARPAPPAPEPLPQPDAKAENNSEQAPAAPPPVQPLPGEPLDLPEAPQPARKYWRWGLLALLVALCLAWYFIDPRFKDQAAAPEATPAANNAAAPEATPTANNAAAPETKSAAAAPEAKARTVIEEVNSFFRSERLSPPSAMQLAARLSAKTAADQDAIYRLYYFAAENGEPAAFVPYAAALDPALKQWGTIEKNAVEALAFYAKADSPQSRMAQERLKAWLERETAAGNAQARQWLEEIRR